LLLGLAVLAAADLFLASPAGHWTIFLGVALWGLHLGLTQGLLATLVADTAPAPLRGTAFGVFNLVAGVATLLASVIAGLVWERLGPAATFHIAIGFCALAAVGVAWRGRFSGAAA